MKHVTLAACAVVCAALLYPATGGAHIQQTQGSLSHRLHARVAHDRGVVAAIDRQARQAGSAMFLDWHTWLVRQWHARDLASAQAALARLQRPTHFAGWLCIHHGEGAWNANTGNGFYGGLQMTSGWGGISRPDLLSPLAQMQAAEAGYRASGYSHAWLAGQWPNTYPPCARYF